MKTKMDGLNEKHMDEMAQMMRQANTDAERFCDAVSTIVRYGKSAVIYETRFERTIIKQTLFNGESYEF